MSQGFFRRSSRCAGTLHSKPSTAPETRQRSEPPHGTGQCVTPERDEKMFPMTNRGDVFMKTKEAESFPPPSGSTGRPGVVSFEESGARARVRRTPGTRGRRAEPEPEVEAATGRGCVRLREDGGRARRRDGSGKADRTPEIMEDVMRCRTRGPVRGRRRRKNSEMLRTL